jgi:hypothetical protein
MLCAENNIDEQSEYRNQTLCSLCKSGSDEVLSDVIPVYLTLLTPMQTSVRPALAKGAS